MGLSPLSYNYLEVQCNFRRNGCLAYVYLKDREDHHAKCEHNPNAELPCIWGCGAKVLVKNRDTHKHKCVCYLQECMSNRDAQVVALTVEVTDLKEAFAKLQVKDLKVPKHPYTLKPLANS